jgi:hypothetical protein
LPLFKTRVLPAAGRLAAAVARRGVKAGRMTHDSGARVDFDSLVAIHTAIHCIRVHSNCFTAAARDTNQRALVAPS